MCNGEPVFDRLNSGSERAKRGFQRGQEKCKLPLIGSLHDCLDSTPPKHRPSRAHNTTQQRGHEQWEVSGHRGKPETRDNNSHRNSAKAERRKERKPIRFGATGQGKSDKAVVSLKKSWLRLSLSVEPYGAKRGPSPKHMQSYHYRRHRGTRHCSAY